MQCQAKQQQQNPRHLRQQHCHNLLSAKALSRPLGPRSLLAIERFLNAKEGQPPLQPHGSEHRTSSNEGVPSGIGWAPPVTLEVLDSRLRLNQMASLITSIEIVRSLPAKSLSSVKKSMQWHSCSCHLTPQPLHTCPESCQSHVLAQLTHRPTSATVHMHTSSVDGLLMP